MKGSLGLCLAQSTAPLIGAERDCSQFVGGGLLKVPQVKLQSIIDYSGNGDDT